MKEIILSQGRVALVDDDDYGWLNSRKWQAVYKKGDNTFYATRGEIVSGGHHTTLLMHREILGLKTGDKRLGDHRNRNGLDNQRLNLRIVNNSLNSYNKKSLSNNTSGFRGVCWSRPHGQCLR